MSLCLALPLLGTGCGDRAEDMSVNALNAAQNAYEIYSVYGPDGPPHAPAEDAPPPDEPIEIAEADALRAERYAADTSDDEARPVVPPPPPLLEDEFIDPFSTEEEDEALEDEAATETETQELAEEATEEAEPAAEPDAGQITPAKVDQLINGISYTEARDILGVDGAVISTSGDDGEVVMYRFADARGANFMARFENDQLTRKTNLHVPQSTVVVIADEAAADNDEDDGERQVGARQRPQPRPTRQLEPEPEPETTEEEEIAADEEEAREDEEEIVEEAPVPVEEEPAEEPTETQPDTPQEDAQAEQQDAQQEDEDIFEEQHEEQFEEQFEEVYEEAPLVRAQLPAYRRSIRRGIHNLRLSNPTQSNVEVGVRAGTNGQNANVRAGGSQTLRVESGTYQIYYIFSDNPYALHGGGSVSLESYGLPDADIILQEGGFNIQHFDPMRY